MRLLFFVGATLSILATATNDPSGCASAARLLAQQKALQNGNGPGRLLRWDKYPPEISVSPNGAMVTLNSLSSDSSGQPLETDVVFIRRADGSWAAHRTVKKDGRVIESESESWVQPTIPLTRETILEHRYESGPITNESLPMNLAAFQKLHGIPDSEVDRAYKELRQKAFSSSRPRWFPKEAVVSAVELAYVRMDIEKLESIVQKGAAAFGLTPKEVESQLKGRVRPNLEITNQEQSDYFQLLGALRSLESRGVGFEVQSIRTRLVERLSPSGRARTID